jgi:hypothetical protein
MDIRRIRIHPTLGWKQRWVIINTFLFLLLVPHFTILYFSTFKDPAKPFVKFKRKDKEPCLNVDSLTLY